MLGPIACCYLKLDYRSIAATVSKAPIPSATWVSDSKLLPVFNDPGRASEKCMLQKEHH